MGSILSLLLGASSSRSYTVTETICPEMKPEDDEAMRNEIERMGGLESLTAHQITGFISRALETHNYDMLMELYRRSERRVKSELQEEGGVASLTDIQHITSLMRRAQYFSALWKELDRRRDQLETPDSKETNDQSLQCQICYEYEADILIQPCNHLVCGQDFKRLRNCPWCRGPIKARRLLRCDFNLFRFWGSITSEGSGFVWLGWAGTPGWFRDN